jgi:hypothetical protein
VLLEISEWRGNISDAVIFCEFLPNKNIIFKPKTTFLTLKLCGFTKINYEMLIKVFGMKK